jgi:hypothetical protein
MNRSPHDATSSRIDRGRGVERLVQRHKIRRAIHCCKWIRAFVGSRRRLPPPDGSPPGLGALREVGLFWHGVGRMAAIVATLAGSAPATTAWQVPDGPHFVVAVVIEAAAPPEIFRTAQSSVTDIYRSMGVGVVWIDTFAGALK